MRHKINGFKFVLWMMVWCSPIAWFTAGGWIVFAIATGFLALIAVVENGFASLLPPQPPPPGMAGALAELAAARTPPYRDDDDTPVIPPPVVAAPPPRPRTLDEVSRGAREIERGDPSKLRRPPQNVRA